MAESKTEKANKIVVDYVRGSLAVGLVPVALLDLAILSGIQLKMLHSLTKLYHVEFSEQRGKALIAALIGGAVPTSVSMNVTSALKTFPIIGFATGMITISLLGSVCTFAVGKVFIQHFEAGGTLLDFDPKAMQAYFISQSEKVTPVVRTSFVGMRP
ncbi:YcjF family protein [Chloroflexi bacterium TSY]|nr:YcjF family protein [Chloroflexi bacterium TSY]